MTLTIELTPEEQANLALQAAARGLALPEFVKLRALELIGDVIEEDAKLTNSLKQLSGPAFMAVWDNDADAAYDNL